MLSKFIQVIIHVTIINIITKKYTQIFFRYIGLGHTKMLGPI